ncbi:MAG: hypothetical protein HQL43_00060 [Alphaproteobacteria bacterium]|nr:hypothetical protein [Alphaproteobacteria bacterium]
MSAEVINLELANLAAARTFADRHIRPDYLVFKDETYFTWQFKTPCSEEIDSGGACLALREEDERLSALVVARTEGIWARGRLIQGAWLHELYAEPERQGAGMLLLRKMIRAHGFIGLAGHSTYSSVVLGSLCPLIDFELERLFAVCDPKATLALIGQPSEVTPSYVAMNRIGAAGGELEILTGFDAAYDADWADFKSRLSLATDRTAAMMRWRYLDHPVFRYHCRRVRTAFGNAYFVWREEAVADRAERIARMCEAIGSPKALAAGFPALHGEMTSQGIAFADFFCSNASVLAGLAAGGMRRVIPHPDFDLPRLFAPLALDMRRRLKFGFALCPAAPEDNWHDVSQTYFTKGDVNQDRPNRVL